MSDSESWELMTIPQDKVIAAVASKRQVIQTQIFKLKAITNEENIN